MLKADTLSGFPKREQDLVNADIKTLDEPQKEERRYIIQKVGRYMDRIKSELKKNQAQDQDKPEGKDKPESGAPDNQKPSQEKNEPKPPKPPEKVDHPDISGRWGVLPPKIQDDILNFNIDNFPQKYRKWLEEYYKSINRKKRR